MTLNHFTYHLSKERLSSLFVLSAAVAGSLVLVNIIFDRSMSYWRESAFYLSESLLFSSFWLLFILLIPALLYVQKSQPRYWVRLALAAMTCLLHLALYPGLVWSLSKVFFQNTFEFQQTLEFSLNTYSFVTLIVYALTGMVRSNVQNKPQAASPSFLTTIIVAEHGEHRLIAVGQILYISSNPPYVNLHVEARKHLYKGTLRALEGQLNPEQFIRIHKSCIVNLRYVVSLRSRQNGDYDVALADGTALRVSRIYAPELKRHLASLVSQHDSLV